MKIDKFYYINLDDDVERNSLTLNEIKKSSVLTNNIERLSAVKGKDIDLSKLNYPITEEAILDITTNHRNNELGGLVLTYGGLGYWVTFCDLLKLSVENNETYFVMDDDQFVNENFDTLLSDVLNELPEDFDFCYTSTLTPQNMYKLEPYSANLHTPKSALWGPNSFIISPKGSKNILDMIFPIRYQNDSHLHMLVGRLQYYVSNINLTTYNPNLESTIQIKK
jgi:GR25 family glycosyltransferase involved in LPS biosynthesis